MLIVPQIETFRDEHPLLYESLKAIVAAVNNSARQANVDPAKQAIDPAPIDSIVVTAADGVFDIAITDTSNPDKGINYFAEYSLDAGFTAPVVLDLGSSRNLRTFLGNQTVYFRGYSQYVGSNPSTPVNFGDPTAVVGGGPAGPAPQPSQGSGSSGGDDPGGGFGKGEDDGSGRGERNLF